MTRRKDSAIKVRFDQSTYTELESIAHHLGEGISVVVRDAVRCYLAKRRSNLDPTLISQLTITEAQKGN